MAMTLMTITLDAILKMNSAELFKTTCAAAPLDLDAIADTSYTGIDLSLPSWMHSILWKSFRKTFHRDPVTGVLRGWNVKVQQTGLTHPEPRSDRRRGRGRAVTTRLRGVSQPAGPHARRPRRPGVQGRGPARQP